MNRLAAVMHNRENNVILQISTSLPPIPAVKPGMRIAVLGANSLIGQHFVRLLQKETEINVITWSFSDGLLKRIGGIQLNTTHYKGSSELGLAVRNADVVVNLHEYQDLSLLPDANLMHKHNVEIVRSLLFQMNNSGRTAKLVHLSSAFLQCSSRWPNVNEPESSAEKYRTQWPFPVYCGSKFEAEELVRSANIDTLVMRAVPCYGDGDESSILTDLIWAADWIGHVPVIGDKGGVMQMCSVANAAAGLWSGVRYLLGPGANDDIAPSPVEVSSFGDEKKGVKVVELSTTVDSDFSYLVRNGMAEVISARALYGSPGLGMNSENSDKDVMTSEEESVSASDSKKGHVQVFEFPSPGSAIEVISARSLFGSPGDGKSGENDKQKVAEAEDGCLFVDPDLEKDDVIADAGESELILDGSQVDNLEESLLSLDTTQQSANSSFCSELNCSQLAASKYEVVLLADETPINDLYTSLGHLLINGKRSLSWYSVPLLPIYYLYLMLAHIIILLSNCFAMPDSVSSLPHPSLLYFYFHHWTFFNTSKIRFLLGHKAPYSHKESLAEARSHYRRMNSDSVTRFSWKPLIR